MRLGEIQALRLRDLSLAWKDGTIQRGEVPVPKSKTAAGTGRLIPLSQRVCACLSLWLERFPNAGSDALLFPHHKVGLAGNSRSPVLWDIDPERPMGSWRKAWRLACEVAGVRYRPHDMRHTFISRLAENPKVSEQTTKALAGHVSRQMLERYSHIRSQAKQAAIQALEQQAVEPILQVTGHKIGHSEVKSNVLRKANSLKTNGGPARIRTWDQRIMSRSSRIPLDASALLLSASETTSKKEQCYPIVRRIPDLIPIPVTAASQSVLGALPPIRYRAPSSSIILPIELL